MIIENTNKKKKEYNWNGMGRANWEYGDIYEGHSDNNKMMGWGRYIYKDGSYYIGQFKNSKGHGLGKLVKYSGIEFEGQFKYGEFID